MRILIDDKIQASDAPDAIKSPALADYSTLTTVTITLAGTETIDCIGIGGTDAETVTINGTDVSYIESGLYMIADTDTDTLTISHDGTYIGRIAAGKSRFLGAAPMREPGFYTTEVTRVTASGQVIPGAGGYSGRRIGLDFRYKIDADIFQDFQDAYATQIAKGFPFFLYFDMETHRMPWTRLYGRTDNELLFQSSVNRFLYSRRFEFQEAF